MEVKMELSIALQTKMVTSVARKLGKHNDEEYDSSASFW